MALIHCPNCGREVSDEAVTCPVCGFQLKQEPEKRKCSNCGQELVEGMKFCPNCGHPVEGSTGAAQGVSKDGEKAQDIPEGKGVEKGNPAEEGPGQSDSAGGSAQGKPAGKGSTQGGPAEGGPAQENSENAGNPTGEDSHGNPEDTGKPIAGESQKNAGGKGTCQISQGEAGSQDDFEEEGEAYEIVEAVPVQNGPAQEDNETQTPDKKHGRKHGKHRLILGIILAALIAATFAAFGIVAHNIDKARAIQEQQEKEEEEKQKQAQEKFEYQMQLYDAERDILSGATDAETCGNLILSVWNNCIFEVEDVETDQYTQPNGYFLDDFNDAIGNLYDDASFSSKLDAIESNQETVKSDMSKLKNPPDEYKDAYDQMTEFYESYLTFTNLVLNPSGNLQTFSSNFHDADDDVVNNYDILQVYLGDGTDEDQGDSQ